MKKQKLELTWIGKDARPKLEPRILLGDAEKAKADAAVTWCKNASEYSQAQGGKPWKYLLIPHDVVAHNVTLPALAGRFSR